MNSGYIESEKILARKDIVEWLDGCGAKWALGEKFSGIGKSILEELAKPDKFVWFNHPIHKSKFSYGGAEDKHTRCQTPEQFCELIAECLGIDKPVFGEPIKGMAIDIKLFTLDERKKLSELIPDAENSIRQSVKREMLFACYPDGFGFASLPHYSAEGLTITDSPQVFMEYVAQQTGKEYKPKTEGTLEGIGQIEGLPEWLADKYQKPPLGLRPKYIADQERMQEIQQAIDRYKMANKRVPEEWLQDHYDLNVKLCSVQHPHKTYRILDSLDGIPLDTRFKLSEKTPTPRKKVLLIFEDKFFEGWVQYVDEFGFRIGSDSKDYFSVLDGEWMRIV